MRTISQKLRPDVECAPWVIEEVKKLEAHVADQSNGLQAKDERIAVLQQENEALRAEMLTPRVFNRLLEWLRSDPLRPANGAFTAGIERQIAYALEMDVLPEVKRLRIQLANAEAELRRLRRGESICIKCGLRQDAVTTATEPPF